MRWFVRGALAGLCALALLSPSRAQKEGENGTVAGKVTYKGQPLKGGTITFVGPKNRGIVGKIGEDGGYSITNLPPAKYRLAVETDTARPKPGQPDTGKYVAIPRKYGGFTTSGLTLEVKAGKQTHDVSLD